RPKELLKLFKIHNERILSVYIEKKLKAQRCDIILETENNLYIIEVKLFYANPIPQLLKQKRELAKESNKTIKLIGITNNRSVKGNNIQIYNWNSIFNALNGAKNKNEAFLMEELMKHLKKHGLAIDDQYEIYARELGVEISVNLFLKTYSYICKYPKSSKIEQCRYFAPHFSKKIVTIIPGLSNGISYVSHIKNIEFLETKKEYKTILNQHIKDCKLKHLYKDLDKLVNKVRLENNSKYLLLLLSKPYLVFNPPIKKENLQDGSGWLSKQYFTFEEFFKAWHRINI
ncbi:hypothetical protein ACFLQT_01175, partial [Bacteroidota bacterium]